MKRQIIISIILGLAVGTISAYTILIRSSIALLPWGLVGLVVGYAVGERKLGLICGALYGFFLCFAFLLAGFKGSSFVKFIPLLLVTSLVGAVCGLILALLGNMLQKKFKF